MSLNLAPGVNIPHELIVDILSRLDCRSLLTCKQVCNLFNILINNTAGLRLIIDLDAAGQGDNFMNPSISPSDQLDSLKKHQIAWSNLEWITEQRLPMLEGGLWELYGGVLAQNSPDGDIVFHQLPSEIRSIEQKDWTVRGLNLIVRDFGIDPSQDLLVLIEKPKRSGPHPDYVLRIHLRTMSSGADHPLAIQPVICHKQDDKQDEADYLSYTIQVSANFIGILFVSAEGETELIIWEWKTSMIEFDTAGDSIQSFSFLGEEFIIVTLLTDAHETDDELAKPTLAVVNFREESNGRHQVEDIEHIFFFRYPTLTTDATPIGFEIRSDPSPVWTPSPNIQVPFFTAQHNRLYVISLWLWVKSHMRCVMLFAQTATFLERIHRKNELEDRVYEWSAWGPTKTRIILPSIPPSNVWVCYTNGSRYVALRKDKKRFILDVYDFNLRGLQRAVQMGSDAKASDKYVTSIGVLEKGIFQNTVETSMPYAIQSLPLNLNRAANIAVMCSEDNIIIVDTRANRNEYRIFTF